MNDSEPLLAPVATGVNVTAILQLAPAANEVPQLLTAAKSPVGAMLVIASASTPVLVSATSCAGEVVLMVCAPNVSADGKTAIRRRAVRSRRGRACATDAEADDTVEIVTVDVAPMPRE